MFLYCIIRLCMRGGRVQNTCRLSLAGNILLDHRRSTAIFIRLSSLVAPSDLETMLSK